MANRCVINKGSMMSDGYVMKTGRKVRNRHVMDAVSWMKGNKYMTNTGSMTRNSPLMNTRSMMNTRKTKIFLICSFGLCFALSVCSKTVNFFCFVV